MPNLNFNACNCGPYYPNSICMRRGNSVTNNNVVNPTQISQWAFFTFDSAEEIENNQAIPVVFSGGSGTAITSGENGIVNLTTGSYQIEFKVIARIPANLSLNFGIRLNGNILHSSTVSFTGSLNQIVTMSNAVITTVGVNSSLELVNLSGENVIVLSSNICVRKI